MKRRLLFFFLAAGVIQIAKCGALCQVPIIHWNYPQVAFPDFGNSYSRTNGEMLVLKHYLKPKHIVFDIGANVGSWSRISLELEPDLNLFCFEPAPAPFSHLIKNLSPITDKIYNFALSDHQGKGEFFYFDALDWSEGSSCYHRGFFPGETTKFMQVDLDTLDHFCEINNVKHIDYLKIDTEGSELSILKGSINLLSNHQITAIQFEYGGTYPDAGIKLKDVMELLTKVGYAIFRMSPEGIIPISEWVSSLEDGNYANYFAIIQSEVPGYGLVVFP